MDNKFLGVGRKDSRKKVNKFMKWVGFYEEDNHLKVDGRRVYYWFSLLIIIFLGYEALFVHPLTMDMWGFTSPYLIKLLIITLGSFIGWFFWGYLRLIERVKKLEDANDEESVTEAGK